MSKRRRREVPEADVSFIVLAPVNPFLPKEQQAVSGSYSVRANCGHICWVSPEGLDIFLGPNYSLCQPCDLASFQPMTVGPLPEGARRFSVPGAVEHIREDQGELGVMRMRQWMQDLEVEEL